MNQIVLIALRRPYTFVVMSILIVLVGGLTLLHMPTDVFPNITIPVTSVVWIYIPASSLNRSKGVLLISSNASSPPP
ncbi:MAG: hypothetical protein U0231_13940 [Nitrospiraceae bacterium]